ncbi:MAG: FtsW/RodA/SpoVE family cell cycle protein [Patescibacteria group bacterium]
MLGLFIPVGFLVASSLVVLGSISPELFFLQLSWASLGLVAVITLYFVDWRSIFYYRWAINILYAVSILLLVVVYFSGPLINQTKSWLVFGQFNFQPVELAKVSLILFFARYFSRKHLSVARWSNILTSFGYFAIPAGLVALQPDLGSASVLFVIWLGFLLLSGLPWKRVLVACLVFLVVGIFMWQFYLDDYQKDRIFGMFYPEKNVLGINYSANQAKIAIGSSGFFGKGYGQGTQTQLKFLTEPATDFIISALIEEWGLLGGILGISAFLFLIHQIIKIAANTDKNFEKFICLGAVLSFSWQFFLNVGSNTGISPVVGVTFPFLSYGGSSLLTSFFLLSIINAIGRKN